MNKTFLKKYKILLMSILMSMISLTCDDQVPVDAQAPTLDYSISIITEVVNCQEVDCLEEMCIGDAGCSDFNEEQCESNEGLTCSWEIPNNQAYSAGARNIEELDEFTDYEGYYLFFELKLLDIDQEPVEGANLVVIEEYLEDGAQQGTFRAFKNNDVTNSSGIINGYWKDSGQTGNFMITVKYTDENGDDYTQEYPITVLPTFNVVNEVTIATEDNEILILDAGQGTTAIYAYVENATNKQLENVPVTFGVIGDGKGSLTPQEAYTQAVATEDDEGNIYYPIYAYSIYTTEPGVEEDVVDIFVSIVGDDDNVLYSDTTAVTVTNEIAAAEDDVHSLTTNFAPNQLVMPISDATEDSTYSINLIATVKDEANEALADVTIDFEILTPENTSASVGTLTTGSVESNSSGVAQAIIEVQESIIGNETLFKDSVLVKTSITNPEDGISIIAEETSKIYIYSDEYYDLEVSVMDVEYLINNIIPNPLVISTEDNIDSTYIVEVNATVKDENGVAIENVPINFQSLNANIGTLVASDLLSDSTGTATGRIEIPENQIESYVNMDIRVYIPNPQNEVETLLEATETLNVYTDSYFSTIGASELITWPEQNEEIIDNINIEYTTNLYAKVLNQNGAQMPNMPVLFQRTTPGIGALNTSVAYTDSTGEAATVAFVINPNELNDFPADTTVSVDFSISLYGNQAEGLTATESLTYQINGNTDPEYNVSEFHFYPDIDGISHDLYDQTQISVIAKDNAGVGVSNVLVRFELQEFNSRASNGELSAGFVYTCCNTSTDSTSTQIDSTAIQQNGVASVTYSNIEGGADMLKAYILDPSNSDIIAIDSMMISVNDACPDCVEELNLYSKYYELPTIDSQFEQTDIYAFYTDSTGNPAQQNSFINFQPWQQDEEGEWINVGSISPENAFFVSGTVSDLNGIFPNAPQDSAVVYANATFNMENASGLVKIVGSYLSLSDTLGVQINSTGASFVEIIPPFPSTIAVQGSPEQESTIITAEIRDGNGNLVSDSYITRFTLAYPAAIAGVHFNGEIGVTDTYTLSSNGTSSITLNSGQIPVSVAMTVEVYEIADISSVDDLDNLDIITEASAVPVTVASGPPSSAVIGYSFLEALNIGGGLTELPVSIMLWDAWSNPVADSISVYFTLNPVTAGSIIPEAKTANLKPNGTDEDTWPGVAWTTIQYNASQLFEFPEIIANTTGNACYDIAAQAYDPTITYDLCVAPDYEWQTEVLLTYSSLDNIVSYQNVCVDCSLTLVPLSDTQWDFQCGPGEFTLDVRAQLLDFYGVPVEGAISELLIFGSQGGPTIEAYEYVCYWDNAPFNGQYDQGEEQFDEDGNPIDEDGCNAVPVFTWGQAFTAEPPSTQVLTDEFGLKYWRVTFTDAECIQTSIDPDSYTCSSPSIQANLVNPNGALSEELSITLNSTCAE